MNSRDDLMVIPEMESGGFMCPECLFVGAGKKWIKHTRYCPYCGQHIKISTSEFTELKSKTKDLSFEEKQSCLKYYSVIEPEGMNERVISGINKKKLDNLLKEKEQIAGQMNISDFIS